MEEREGENRGGDEDGDQRKIGRRWGEKGRRRQGKRNRGERGMDFSQGLMRNFRKLQEPFCKA
jgi:hypothetical protein